MAEFVDSWRAMRHTDFQEWADVNLGDTRQVYARDRRLPADAPLVYMPDGEANRFHEDALEGHLICPVPGCPAPRLTTRHSDSRRDHFAHMPNSGISGHANYQEFVVGELLRHWIAEQAGIELLNHEPEPDSPVTILTRLDSGKELAVCYVRKTLGVDAWIQHRSELEREGIASAWIFAPSKRYRSLPKSDSHSPPPSERDDDSEGEFASLLIRDIALFKMMRRCGCWPLLINTETQELVNLLVPGYATATRLGLHSDFAEGVLHAVASPLESCRICEDGIECKPIVYAGSLKKIRQNGRQRLRSEYNKRRGHSPSSRRPTKRRFGTNANADVADIPATFAPSEAPGPFDSPKAPRASTPTEPRQHSEPRQPSESSESPRAQETSEPPQPSESPDSSEHSRSDRPIEAGDRVAPDPRTPSDRETSTVPAATPESRRRRTRVVGFLALLVIAGLAYHSLTAGTRALPAPETTKQSFIAHVDHVYSGGCEERHPVNRFERFIVECARSLPEIREQGLPREVLIRYIQLSPGRRHIEKEFDHGLPRTGLATGCGLLGATGWRISNTLDRGLVVCGQNRYILWCDSHTDLYGQLEVKVDEKYSDVGPIIHLWRQALDATGYYKHAVPVADHHVREC